MASAAETATPASAIPDHVDASLVVDFDYFADRRYAEAGSLHAGMIRLRDEVGQGIFWTPRNGGHWFITDHEMIFEAARTPEIFSSVKASYPPVPEEQEPYFPPLSLDPPEHGPYRLPLMRAFAPGVINAMSKGIRACAIGLIEAVAEKGHCDFLTDVAEPLPITIFMKLMGFPLDRYKEFREWVGWLTGGDVELKLEAFARVAEMSRPLIEERRAAPRADLISPLIEARIEGEPPTQADLEGFCLLMFGAGLDTVVNSLSFSMEYLARNPELQDRLRVDPSLIPETIEELLRRFSVVFPARRVAKDVNFHGAELRTGERCTLYLGLANLDPHAFNDPDTVDIERDNKAHLTFNVGPHRCVGSHLARMEMIILFEEWLKRQPNVRIPAKEKVGYRTGIVFAVTSLPLEWDANAVPS
jgi:cytochrome P450